MFSVLSFQFRKLFSPQRLSAGLAGLCFGILLGIVPDIVVTKSWLLITVVTVGVVAAVISWLLPQSTDLDTVIRSPLTIRSDYDALYYARKGFIGFVPLYTPKPGTAAKLMPPEDRDQAVVNLDFDRLQVEESNLEPTIAAIVAHASKLEHCWLLSTQGANAPGSLPYAKLLVEYLRQRKGITSCTFYYGDAYTISLDDDVLVLQKTYDLVRKTLDEAKGRGLKPREMVADITTGVRSMTLGMLFSCLGRERDIEFIGTRYDDQGKIIKGNLTPIIFSFEPDVQSGS